jgi:hypothetical protein
MRIVEDPTYITIEIAPRRTWENLSVEVYAILIWTFLAFELARMAPPPQLLQKYIISASAISFLAVLSLLAVVRLIWRLWGYEEITLRNATLTVVRRLGLFGWTRVHRLEDVLDLHIAFRSVRRILWAWQSFRVFGGSLAFNCRGRSCRLADRLDDAEAKALLKRFREWLPAVNWSPVLGLR